MTSTVAAATTSSSIVPLCLRSRFCRGIELGWDILPSSVSAPVGPTEESLEYLGYMRLPHEEGESVAPVGLDGLLYPITVHPGETFTVDDDANYREMGSLGGQTSRD